VACLRDASRSFAGGRVGKAAGVVWPAESTRDPAVAFTLHIHLCPNMANSGSSRRSFLLHLAHSFA
jgi:hypothetical protein